MENLIGSAIFAWLTVVTDRQTDRPTMLLRLQVIIDRICIVLRCGLTNMKLKNGNQLAQVIHRFRTN